MEARREEDELLAGRYRLDRTVGHGGMAVVFAATDIVLERPVAIKVFQRRRNHGAELHERFLREARAEAKIVAPEVVTVYDVGETDDGRPFLVLEFVEGRPLSEVIAGGPLDAERVAAIGADVAAGLQAAHELSIVHRDVKPANILVEPDGGAKLGDFGLARVFDEEQAALTAPGSLLGSAHYVAPEQVRAGEASPRSDLYALGATLFHALVGVPPFEGVAAMDIAMRRLDGPAPRVADRLPGADAELAGLIEDLLQRNPDRRPATAGEVAMELHAIAARMRATRTAAEAATVFGLPLPPPRRRRRTTVQQLLAASSPFVAAGAGAVQRGASSLRARLAYVPQPSYGEAAVAAGVALFLLLLVAALGAPHPQSNNVTARAASVQHAVLPPKPLVLQRKPPVPTVVDVRGRDASSATKTLVAAHYAVALYAVSSSQPPGTVLAERPQPGSALARGGTVALDVAVGVPVYAEPRHPGGNGDGGD